MANKRTRAPEATQAAAAPASLVTEVFDCLMQASRKELAQLLTVLVKASSAIVLEQVRDVAVNSGALVATSSRFQRCSYTLLDSFFSFLDEKDLRTSDVVCRRWRFAQSDSGAGWKTALSADPINLSATWMRQLVRRRIAPESLSKLHSVTISRESAAVLSSFKKLPRLRSLHISSPIHQDFVTMLSTLPIKKVSLSASTESTSMVQTLKHLVSSNLAKTIRNLDCADAISNKSAKALAKMTALRYLRVVEPEDRYLALPTLSSVHTLHLVGLSELRTGERLVSSCPALTDLTISRSSLSPLDINAIAALPALTALKLGEETTINLHSTSLLPLANLTNLVTLKMDFMHDDIRLTASSLQFLSALVQLTDLDVRTARLSDNDLKLFAPLTKLREVALIDVTEFTGSGLAVFSNAPSLQSLCLLFCHDLTPPGVEAIRSLTHLRRLTWLMGSSKTLANEFAALRNAMPALIID